MLFLKLSVSVELRCRLTRIPARLVKFDDAHGAPGAPWARALCLFPHKKKPRKKKCIDFHDKNKKHMGPWGPQAPEAQTKGFFHIKKS